MRGLLRDRYIAIFLMLFISLFFTMSIPYQVVAQNEQLYIDAPGDVEEGEEFLIYVYILNDTLYPTYLTDVDIEFNDQQYQITDSGEYPELSIEAPSVNEDTEFTITAGKEGYNSTTHEITVLNRMSKLVITPDEHTIDEGEYFSVLITDSESGGKIEGASVYIENIFDAESTTDGNGRALLKAPSDEGSFRIIAQKDGYQDGEETLWVNAQPSIWDQLRQNPNTFVAIAAILLISAVIYVTVRQRKGIDDRAKEISKEDNLEKYGVSQSATLSSSDKNDDKGVGQSSLKENVRTQPQRVAKVEEIRISKPREEKTIVSASDKKEDEEKSQEEDIDPESEWFKGTDDVRYEIDKITGEIDEEGKDKWFEGIDDIRAKIDEKVKKKDKTKVESNGEGE